MKTRTEKRYSSFKLLGQEIYKEFNSFSVPFFYMHLSFIRSMMYLISLEMNTMYVFYVFEWLEQLITSFDVAYQNNFWSILTFSMFRILWHFALDFDHTTTSQISRPTCRILNEHPHTLL